MGDAALHSKVWFDMLSAWCKEKFQFYITTVSIFTTWLVLPLRVIPTNMFERFLSLSSWPVIQPDVGFFTFLRENPNYARTISLGNTMLQLLLLFSALFTHFQNVLCIIAGKNTSLMCLRMLRWPYLGPKSQIWVLYAVIYLMFSEHLEQSAAVIE